MNYDGRDGPSNRVHWLQPQNGNLSLGDADQDPWMELLNVAVLLGKHRNHLNIQQQEIV